MRMDLSLLLLVTPVMPPAAAMPAPPIGNVPMGAVARWPPAEAEIISGGHVRKQPGVLKDIADPAPPWWNEQPGSAVEYCAIVQRNASVLRSQQAGDGVDDTCLSGTRRTGQRGDACLLHAEPHVQRKAAEIVPNLDSNAHRSTTVRARRLISSERVILASASRIERTESIAASASPRGVCSAL